jgi:hypothetical protein
MLNMQGKAVVTASACYATHTHTHATHTHTCRHLRALERVAMPHTHMQSPASEHVDALLRKEVVIQL